MQSLRTWGEAEVVKFKTNFIPKLEIVVSFSCLWDILKATMMECIECVIKLLI